MFIIVFLEELIKANSLSWQCLAQFQFNSSVDSDMDRSLLSRPVTKLSRSTAVTTPNTICFRLAEPSVKSGE